MSQAKVDNYKKNKANRQKMMKKEKFLHRLEMVGITLVCVVCESGKSTGHYAGNCRI